MSIICYMQNMRISCYVNPPKLYDPKNCVRGQQMDQLKFTNPIWIICFEVAHYNFLFADSMSTSIGLTSGYVHSLQRQCSP